MSAAAAKIKKAGGKLAKQSAKKATEFIEPVKTSVVPTDPVVDLSTPQAGGDAG